MRRIALSAVFIYTLALSQPPFQTPGGRITEEYIITTVAGDIDPSDVPNATATSLANPRRVAVDANGTLYISNSTYSLIQEVSPDGTIRTVAGNGNFGFSGDGGTARAASLNAPEGLALDGSGNLYIADTSNHRIRKVTPDGRIQTVAGNGTSGFSGDGGPATAAEMNDPWGVALDGDGNLYIADCGNNRIRRVSVNGTISTVAGNGMYLFNGDGVAATAATLGNPYDVAVDNNGNIYIADSGNNRIRKVVRDGTISTLAGTGMGAFSGDGGAASGASLADPSGVAVDASGNVFVADTGDQRIRKVTPDGTISTVAGGGSGYFSGDGGPATAAALYYPAGVAADGAGNLFIADTGNQRIRKVAPDGTIRTVAGGGNRYFNGDGGAATATYLNQPKEAVVDRNGSLYIADTGNQRIRMVTPDGRIRTVAGNGTQGFSGDGGPATAASLYNPYGLAVDGSGNLYIADTDNNRIRKVTPDGIIHTVAGNGDFNGFYHFSGDGGPATAASLLWPTGVAVDSSGNLFIADYGYERIREVTVDGMIRTVAGGGDDGLGDGVAATAAVLSYPMDVAVDGSGNLYIADTWNQRIRRVKPDGIIQTVAGGGKPDAAGYGTAGFSGDGAPAAAAFLSYPRSVALDSLGNLYIADGGNSRIRKITPDGIIRTVAGNGSTVVGIDGEPATATSVSYPQSVAADANGNLYVVDGSGRVRKLTPQRRPKRP